MKGLPKQLETFSTEAKFSRDEKSLDEWKRVSLIFDRERQVTETERAFNSENKFCFKFHKRGHVSKLCRGNLDSRRDKTNPKNFSAMKTSSLDLLQNIAQQRKFFL